MAAQKIKKGDTVVVLSGKDKGRTGEVVKAMPKDGKVIVSGINVHARHRKPSQTSPQGGIERKEAPLHVSKVAIATADGKPTRVRFEVREGKKVRVAAKTGALIHGSTRSSSTWASATRPRTKSASRRRRPKCSRSPVRSR